MMKNILIFFSIYLDVQNIRQYLKYYSLYYVHIYIFDNIDKSRGYQ